MNGKIEITKTEYADGTIEFSACENMGNGFRNYHAKIRQVAGVGYSVCDSHDMREIIVKDIDSAREFFAFGECLANPYRRAVNLAALAHID